MPRYLENRYYYGEDIRRALWTAGLSYAWNSFVVPWLESRGIDPYSPLQPQVVQGIGRIVAREVGISYNKLVSILTEGPKPSDFISIQYDDSKQNDISVLSEPLSTNTSSYPPGKRRLFIGPSARNKMYGRVSSRVRTKRHRGPSIWDLKGYRRCNEFGGRLESSECVYLGHSTGNLMYFVHSIWGAVIRRLWNMMKIDIVDWKSHIRLPFSGFHNNATESDLYASKTSTSVNRQEMHISLILGYVVNYNNETDDVTPTQVKLHRVVTFPGRDWHNYTYSSLVATLQNGVKNCFAFAKSDSSVSYDILFIDLDMFDPGTHTTKPDGVTEEFILPEQQQMRSPFVRLYLRDMKFVYETSSVLRFQNTTISSQQHNNTEDTHSMFDVEHNPLVGRMYSLKHKWANGFTYADLQHPERSGRQLEKLVCNNETGIIKFNYTEIDNVYLQKPPKQPWVFGAKHGGNVVMDAGQIKYSRLKWKCTMSFHTLCTEYREIIPNIGFQEPFDDSVCPDHLYTNLGNCSLIGLEKLLDSRLSDSSDIRLSYQLDTYHRCILRNRKRPAAIGLVRTYAIPQNLEADSDEEKDVDGVYDDDTFDTLNVDTSEHYDDERDVDDDASEEPPATVPTMMSFGN